MFQSTPTGFPAGDYSFRSASRVMTLAFQSTPTGFPAGDSDTISSLSRSSMFQSTPTGFPAGDRHAVRPTLEALAVSIHADRFPGRRPRPPRLPPWPTPFQSTPTGFPAGDVARCPGRPCQAVSIHADRFPGRRRHGAGRSRPPHRFNPRRPVSRPATGMWHRTIPPSSCFNPRRPVSRPATAGDLLLVYSTTEFQSTPTGFPAGD